VHDPLYVRTLLLESGAARVALLVIDLTSLSPDSVASEKAIVAEAAGVDAANVFISVSHTFSAPHFGMMGGASGEQKSKDSMLGEAVASAIRVSASEAKQGLREAAIGFGSGSSNVNVNRDILTSEGWWHGHNEQGVSDKEVSVVKLEARDGSTIAILMNYAVQSSIMNESVMADGGKLVTGDLAGAAARYVERQYGDKVVALFAIGAAGDQEPYLTADRYVLDKDGKFSRIDIGATGFTLVDLLGERLGAEVVRVGGEIKSPRTQAQLKVVSEVLTCKGQAIERDLSSLKPTKSYVYQPSADISAPIYIVRIGEVCLVAVQVELSSSTAIDIKARSPFKDTIVMTMVNGAAKYMADSGSYDRFTYEAMNSMYQKGSAEALEAKILSMLDRLKNE
jgi:hypothetical protein